jgi:hypothetical protein
LRQNVHLGVEHPLDFGPRLGVAESREPGALALDEHRHLARKTETCLFQGKTEAPVVVDAGRKICHAVIAGRGNHLHEGGEV